LSILKKNNLTILNKSACKLSDQVFLSVLQIVAETEKIDNRSINLMLTNDGSIRDYNRRFLGNDALTDVISFRSDIDFIPFLGDIIIDTDVADEQKGKKSLKDELQILFLHGLLHLLGYDHLSAGDEVIMKNKEREYLSKIREKS